MYPSFLDWGWIWRPFDHLVINGYSDIVVQVNLRLQSQRDRKTAATVGATRVPPEKPRPPRAV